MTYNKSRILFVGPYPPPFAGPEASMKCLLESPLIERFDIAFLNTNFRKSNSQRGVFDISLVKAYFVFVQRLISKLIVHKPAVVYYFVTATLLGWLGRDVWCIFLSRLFGAKIVLHMRAGHFRRNFENGGIVVRMFIRSACSLVSCGIVQANSLRDQFTGLLPDCKIVSIYNTIDTAKFNDDQKQSYHPEMVLFLGHLAQSKGYCDLLKVIPEIVEFNPKIRFHFAGTLIKRETNVTCNQITGERFALEDPEWCFDRYIRGHCEENYIYHGIAGEELKLSLLRECAIFVLPSYSEGFSMAVLEALSMGKSVVCTPVGALREVVKHEVNGLICQPGDIQGLKNNILELLKNKSLRDRIGGANAEYVRNNFAVDIISQELGNLFDSVIKNNLEVS